MYWAQRNERERIEAVNPNICGGSYELDSDECIVTRSVADARGNEVRTKDENGTEIQSNAYDENGLRIRSGSKDYCYADGMLIASGDTEYIIDPYGNVISAYYDSDYYVYSSDIQGSTACITDGDNISAEYEYSDFGEAAATADESFFNEICYTGAVYDNATGMYYMRARYYEPGTGRFITQDTYRGEVSDSNTWNLCAYCSNDPVNYTDPSGHKKVFSSRTTLFVRYEKGKFQATTVRLTVKITLWHKGGLIQQYYLEDSVDSIPFFAQVARKPRKHRAFMSKSKRYLYLQYAWYFVSGITNTTHDMITGYYTLEAKVSSKNVICNYTKEMSPIAYQAYRWTRR